ncbi:hypothetical protein CW306_18160 [Bacillus sp. BA3]|nr:hypothetical protein CW306_18160 [Bacillus sp. BA3]
MSQVYDAISPLTHPKLSMFTDGQFLILCRQQLENAVGSLAGSSAFALTAIFLWHQLRGICLKAKFIHIPAP